MTNLFRCLDGTLIAIMYHVYNILIVVKMLVIQACLE